MAMQYSINLAARLKCYRRHGPRDSP